MNNVKLHSPVDFVKDFGDAIGGILIGFAIGRHGNTAAGVIGTIFILLSIYLRFYNKPKI